ncbi:MAG: NERD domain-containing protein [Actinomycetia bacterium]|nr:NERD domain-containing protein [Actinomycetes bacterium]
MARVYRQAPEAPARQAFEAMWVEKAAAEDRAWAARVTPRVLPWLRPVILPLAGWVRATRLARYQDQGRRGEDRCVRWIRWALPGDWLCVPDVVIAVGTRWAQIDRLCVGWRGVYLVECKTWRGAVGAVGDHWWRWEGPRRVTLESPTRQHQRHLALFEAWARARGLAVPVQGILAILDAQRLAIRDVPWPVVTSPWGLVRQLREQDRGAAVLSAALRTPWLRALPVWAGGTPPRPSGASRRAGGGTGWATPGRAKIGWTVDSPPYTVDRVLPGARGCMEASLAAASANTGVRRPATRSWLVAMPSRADTRGAALTARGGTGSRGVRWRRGDGMQASDKNAATVPAPGG